MICLRFGLVALLLGAAAPASGQTLWQNVSAGMTADQIRQAQPEAVVPVKKDTLNGGEAVCELQLQLYAVSANEFDVCFFMKGGKLIQVMMTARSPSRTIFHSMVELLRARYGRELSSGDDACRTTGSLNLCKSGWLLESGVNITAIYVDIGGRGPLVNIVYQTRLRDESVKL